MTMNVGMYGNSGAGSMYADGDAYSMGYAMNEDTHNASQYSNYEDHNSSGEHYTPSPRSGGASSPSRHYNASYYPIDSYNSDGYDNTVDQSRHIITSHCQKLQNDELYQQPTAQTDAVNIITSNGLSYTNLDYTTNYSNQKLETQYIDRVNNYQQKHHCNDYQSMHHQDILHHHHHHHHHHRHDNYVLHGNEYVHPQHLPVTIATGNESLDTGQQYRHHHHHPELQHQHYQNIKEENGTAHLVHHPSVVNELYDHHQQTLHHHPHQRAGQQQQHQQQQQQQQMQSSVPTYKWMQVKRNVPKPSGE